MGDVIPPRRPTARDPGDASCPTPSGDAGKTADFRTRLCFLGLLLLSLAAIAIGIWPSVLTLGALVSVPLALIAIAGLIRPRRILESRALRRTAAGGAVLLAAELGLLLVAIAWTLRRPVELVTLSTGPSRARIVYGVADGAPRRWLHWSRRFDVPASGVVYTRYAPDNGWYRGTELRPLRVIVADDPDHRRRTQGRWFGGGSAPVGRCVVTYEDFALAPDVVPPAPRSTVPGGTPAGPLDSIHTWGLACRDGRLVRATGTDSTLRRSGAPCYYDGIGNMTCGIDLRD